MISVIIPIFNGEIYIRSLIDLLESITYRNFEAVFIDNNSTDNSLEELNWRLMNSDIQYQILEEKESGAGNARNKGITFSKGEYIAFLDCDDKIDPNKFAYDMAIFDANDVDFVFCRTVRYYEDGRIVKHPIDGFVEGINTSPKLGLIWLQNYFYLQGTGAIVVKKDVVQKLGGFHSMKRGEDAFFFIKLGLFNNGYFYKKEFFFYLRHSNSTVSSDNRLNDGVLLSYFNLRKNLFNDSQVFNCIDSRSILVKQLNIDLLKLQNRGYNIKLFLGDEKLHKFKRSSFLFNPVSRFINNNVFSIKYNPFFQIWIRMDKLKYNYFEKWKK